MESFEQIDKAVKAYDKSVAKAPQVDVVEVIQVAKPILAFVSRFIPKRWRCVIETLVSALDVIDTPLKVPRKTL